MLRLLHTADWHIGHQLYGYDRTDEFRHFFSTLLRVAEEEKPDAMTVCGDIFDVPSPSAASLRLFTESLLCIRRALPDAPIIVIAGNHDSASRLEATSGLWRRLKVDVVGSYDISAADSTTDYTRCIVKIEKKGVVAAAPYIVRHFCCNGRREGRERAVYEALATEATKAAGGLPTILAAHIGVAGSDTAGHDGHGTPDTIGNLETVERSALGDTWNYVALGHIHRPQNLSPRVRYSGAAIPVGFDEAYPHTVSIVDVPDDGDPSVREIEMKPLRQLVTFPTIAAPWEEALQQLGESRLGNGCYLRLNVAYTPETPADLREKTIETLRGRDIRFCTILFRHAYSQTDSQEGHRLRDIDEFSRTDPSEIAADFLASQGIGESELPEYIEMINKVRGNLSEEKAKI